MELACKISDMVNAENKYILAIDLGTSGPKVALVSGTGEVVASEFEPNRLILLPGGGAEQDPDEWFDSIMTAAKRLLAARTELRAKVTAVCCTTQWSGTVAVDEHGRHLMNAVIWMDSRGAPYAKELARGFPSLEGYGLFKVLRWVRLTGGAPTRSGKDSLSHILFIKRERPEVYLKTHKFLEPKDYINLRLSGLFAASYDSIALHWLTDNRKIDEIAYSDKLLAMAGLDRHRFPDLHRAVDVLGPLKPEIASELGLPDDVKVVMGTPDVQSAAIGSGAVADYAGHLYIGTSSWITCHVPYKKTDLIHNMASLPSAVPGRYFVANSQEVAGGALSYLLDNIIYPDDDLACGPRPENAYQIVDRLAASAPAGCDKLLFTPWLYGERTPFEDSSLRACFVNMSLKTTRAQMVRAVLEGVAFNTRWLLLYVEKFIGKKFEQLELIGGGARSDTWCQIFADVMNRPMRRVAEPVMANVRGAGLLGAVALGLIAFEDIPRLTRIDRVFEPDQSGHAIYEELFTAFMSVYKRNRKLFAGLNRKG
ncbi:MAG TPA: FGGY-family carbohydrate kinase [Myxococcota bacterium]|nr:FGGY-family carbohydrate kinase [Myxococcota bacterium]